MVIVIMEDGKPVKIADPEKALIDYLYLDKSFTSASLSLDFDKLQDYAQRSGITIKRKIGFLLDQLNVDTHKLYQSLGANKGVSRFTQESKAFSAKWRTYYDHRIIG